MPLLRGNSWLSSATFNSKSWQQVKLKDYDPDDTGGTARRQQEGTGKLEARLAELQEKLYAQSTQSLLVVLQAMDAGGKDGTIKKVFNSVNPQGVRVTSFKAPTADELAHDFLWRIHQHTPPKGYIGIFNRSHYEDVLIVRVNKLVPTRSVGTALRPDQPVRAAAPRQRHAHPQVLPAHQQGRAESSACRIGWIARISGGNSRSTTCRCASSGIDYMEAYEAALTRCNTEYAPWYIVPANHKWYRDLVITRAIVETLEDMKVAYPKPKQDLSGVKIFPD